ncbi:cyclase/dehydrase [Streptomyces sp. JB150]|uniref:cyclase/dehydrase n=1 Tax=Streptomyces sp. JB150 TaxID=2714844 RepID=UPI0014082B7E|nr:cyclase/dehydrase [Streptomyces sp. JB150]QIJ65615.1 cyclase/dehydrase [Streptomyces sp. JB150]
MTGVHTPVVSGRRGLLGEVARSDAAARLRAEAGQYLAAHVRRLLAEAGRGLGTATVRLTGIAEGRDPGFARLARDTGRKLAQGKSPARAALEIAAARLTNRPGRRTARPLTVVGQIDVGVSADEAYEAWARHPHARPATGRRLVRTGRNPRGVVSFHPLGDSLTRVLLVAEYATPRRPAARAGLLLRAPRRRARRALEDFARHVTLRGVPEGDDSPDALPENTRPTPGSRR